jgi:A/G-specific adenine glycosylase
VDFSRILIDWYQKNRRDLPWRNTNDSYLIWISEVILQQTRVVNGIQYYERFVKRFPNLKALARSDLKEVLKIWQGMGYYSRARNLHETARTILNDFQGQFPHNYKEIRKLKGIGDYTAAAILSFSFNQSYPVLDGNVYRVLSRIFGKYVPIDSVDGKKEFREIAEKLIDRKSPGIFNQAIMEFGALQCIPGMPDCRNCPFSPNCIAFRKNDISGLPVKKKRISAKKRYFHYFHFDFPNRQVLIGNRGENDIWKFLYEFPMLEADALMDDPELRETKFFRQLLNGQRNTLLCNVKDYSHILTHQKIHARFFHFMVSDLNFVSSPYEKVSLDDLNKSYPLHKLMINYLENI